MVTWVEIPILSRRRVRGNSPDLGSGDFAASSAVVSTTYSNIKHRYQIASCEAPSALGRLLLVVCFMLRSDSVFG